METDLEKNRQAIPELMRSRWPGAYSEKLIRNIELLMERMIATAEEEAIPEYARGIDGVPHLFRVTRCLLEIAERPPEMGTILAALGHDWDRCLVRTRVARDLFRETESGYEAQKVAHAVVSALEFCGNIIPPDLFDKADIQLARERIVFHEKGGDPEELFRSKLRYMLPEDSRYFKEIKNRISEAINDERLKKPIIPILKDFEKSLQKL